MSDGKWALAVTREKLTPPGSECRQCDLYRIWRETKAKPSHEMPRDRDNH
jgi:hypothetical protein